MKLFKFILLCLFLISTAKADTIYQLIKIPNLEIYNIKTENKLRYLYAKQPFTIGIDNNILLNASLSLSDKDSQFYMDKDLAKFSDVIFYTNGIYDKLFYDTSLTEALVKIPKIRNLRFDYINLTFSRPDSIFYFKNQINFVGAVWQNLFNKN